LIPAADMIANWAHLHFTRSRTLSTGFGVPGCIATQFQLCSGPALTGDASFKLHVYDCMPNWPGLTWVTDAADPFGGTDYYGIGLPLLVSPFGNEFIGLDCFADANGIGTAYAPIPDNPILKNLTYYVQTACLWPEPQFLNGCLPSPLRISTSNLLTIVIQ
jgi:hypothetical protein